MEKDLEDVSRVTMRKSKPLIQSFIHLRNVYSVSGVPDPVIGAGLTKVNIVPTSKILMAYWYG